MEAAFMSDKPPFGQMLWRYLSQPVFSPHFKALNPFRFWYLHSSRYLEMCWLQSEIVRLWRDNFGIDPRTGCAFEPSEFHPELKPGETSVEFLERCWVQEFSTSED